MYKIDVATVVQSPDEFERQVYSGNAIARIKSTETLKLLTVRGHRFVPDKKSATVSDIATTILSAIERSKIMKTMGMAAQDSSHASIDTAKVVLCGGRGIKKKQDFALLQEIARVLPSAAVGASRGAVDDGFAKYEQQVGQSGKCLNSEVYIGIGVSGALQHLAGVVDVKTIISINTDPEANMMKVLTVPMTCGM